MENLHGKLFVIHPRVNFVSQTMNKHINTLVIVGKVYVAWKRKMLHDVIGGHQGCLPFDGKFRKFRMEGKW